MYIKIEQQDGMLNTATNATLKWVDATYPLEKNRIYRVSSDIEQVNGQMVVPNEMTGSLRNKGYFYNTGTSNWDLEYPDDHFFDDLIGLNIIKMSDQYPYICTDDQLSLIPNYLTVPSIRYRINESVTASNAARFKHYKEVDSAHVAVTYICPSEGSANGIGIQFYHVNVENSKVSLGFRNARTDVSPTYILESGSHDIAVSMELNDQGYIDADLQSRVKNLEYQMKQVQQKMAEYDVVIRDIPAITAALQENVTKFYVAR